MTMQRYLVAQSLHTESGSGDENGDVDSEEPSEDEEQVEEEEKVESCEEDPDEEEPCDGESIEEEEVEEEEEEELEEEEEEELEEKEEEEEIEEEEVEEEVEEEEGEEDEVSEEDPVEEESSESLDEETNEAELSEGPAAEPSSGNGCNREERPKSVCSNSGKNRLENHGKEKQNKEQSSKLDLFSGACGIDVRDKSKKSTRNKTLQKARTNEQNSSKSKHGMWDTEATDGDDVATKKRKIGDLRKCEVQNSSLVQKVAVQNACGDSSHLTASCPLKASSIETNTTGHQSRMFTELRGGCLSSFGGPSLSSSTIPATANPLPCNGKPPKEIDETKLFVGYLPSSMSDDKLIELFLPFGRLCQARVVKDKKTKQSKGCGFVQYTDPLCAARAVAQMNGYRIDGKVLAVRIAGIPPPTCSAHLPAYTGPAAIAQFNHVAKDQPGPALSSTPVSSLTTPTTANSGSGGPSQHHAKPPKEIDETKLFVGCLPWHVNDDKLIELFSPFGHLREVCILKDKSTGRSKGSGFIQYIDPLCAAQAMTKMNGYRLNGKVLAVRIAGIPASKSSVHWPAYPVPPIPTHTIPHVANLAPTPGDSSSNNGKIQKQIDESKLFVDNLPQSVNDDRLIQLFLPFGRLCQARVVKDKKTGQSKGCAFVQYTDPVFAAQAVAEMNGYKIDGEVLVVTVAYSHTAAISQSKHGPTNRPGPTCAFPHVANSVYSDSPSNSSNIQKEIDETKLFVTNLPQSVDDDQLIQLFLRFGRLCQACVVKDKKTGLSKGCAFVQYTDPVFAAQAVAEMNGCKLDGKLLAVGVAYSDSVAISQSNNGPINRPGCLLSGSPEACRSYLKSNGVQSQTNLLTGQSPASVGSSGQSKVSALPMTYHTTSSWELAQFPGYRKSLESEPLWELSQFPGYQKSLESEPSKELALFPGYQKSLECEPSRELAEYSGYLNGLHLHNHPYRLNP